MGSLKYSMLYTKHLFDQETVSLSRLFTVCLSCSVDFPLVSVVVQMLLKGLWSLTVVEESNPTRRYGFTSLLMFTVLMHQVFESSLFNPAGDSLPSAGQAKP